MASVKIKQAAAGISTRINTGPPMAVAAEPKIRRSSLAEGRRGFQERSCVSNSFSFVSFIKPFITQRGAQFLQAIAIPARRRVRRNVQQLANGLESEPVPNSHHDHLALSRRQFRQTLHG